MGSTCNPTYPTTGSLNQGAQFASVTAAYHGGTRKSLRRNKKMRTTRGRKQAQRGGSYFASYADYPTAFSTMLPTEIRDIARLGPLDAKFAELPAVERAAGVMAGGSRCNRRSKSRRSKSRRSTRRRGGGGSPVNASYTLLSATNAAAAGVLPTSGGRRRLRGGFMAPVEASPVILTTPQELAAARLNPQWYTENTVIPNFRGDIPYNGGVVPSPSPPPMPKVGGRRRRRFSRRGGGSCVPGTVFSSRAAAIASGCAWTNEKGVFKVAEPLVNNNNAYSHGGGSCVPGTVFSSRAAAIASGCAWTNEKGVFKVAEPLVSNNNAYSHG